MSNDSQRSLQIGALVIPLILAAAGGKMVLNAARLDAYSATGLPSTQELDSLRGYAARPTAFTGPAPAPPTGAYAFGAYDPFSRVTRSETSRYSAPESEIPPARSRSAPWIVSTIMITETRRVAVVNGSVVSTGSALPGGGRVISIEPDHVVVADGSGARRVLSVQGGGD